MGIFLFILTLFVFRNAFSMRFFAYDYFFLKISKAQNILQLLSFFNPFKSYFYRPIPTEIFYFIIQKTNYNFFLIHSLVFVVYFVGIYYLYKSIFLLSKNNYFAQLVIIIYCLSFIHVFQLYWLATFQEVCLFSFLSISFYKYLKQQYLLSVFFFVLALMSKETALLLPLFFVVTGFINHNKLGLKKLILVTLPYFVIALIFLLIYSVGVKQVATIDTYKINLNPKIILNNLAWYMLWGIGFPNVMVEYTKSLFFRFTPEFWLLFKSADFRIYSYVLIAYLGIFLLSLMIYLIKNKNSIKKIMTLAVFTLAGFIIFIAPTLPIIHKWMVRLTLPLIFLSIFQASILYKFAKEGKFFKTVFIILTILYFTWNYYGIKVHESSSSYLFENRIYNNSAVYFAKNKSKILEKKSIYFINYFGDWRSVKLKNSYHDQDFLDYFLPGIKIKAVYEHDSKKIPENSFVIDGGDITK